MGTSKSLYCFRPPALRNRSAGMSITMKHVVIVMAAAAVLAWPFRGLFCRYAVAAIKVVRGKKTVADRISERGPAARRRLSPYFKEAGLSYPPAKVVLVGLKRERLMELWCSNDDTGFRLVRTYRILGASGTAGPKLREGDKQVPEGIYGIASLNPNSLFTLSLRINYPNKLDREHAAAVGRQNMGGDIMIHGGKQSTGCLAIGNDPAADLFVLAADTGIENISVVLSPLDLRRKPLPALKKPHPEWTTNLHLMIRDELYRLGAEREME